MVKKNYVKGEFIFENNLKTNGTMGIGAYTFPNTDGSNGQALLTDGSGTVTWSDVSGGGNTEDGTADGEMLYWDNTASEYKHTKTSELFWDDTNKRVGIGTNSPVEQLEITDNAIVQGQLCIGGTTVDTGGCPLKIVSNVTSAITARVDGQQIGAMAFQNSNTASIYNNFKFNFQLKTDSSVRTSLGIESRFTDISDATRTSIIDFKTANNGVYDTAMVLNGNMLGIGTTTPNEKLVVAGNIFLTTDNNKIFLGADKDASIYYDGTNTYIKTDEVTVSDLIVSCGTDKTLELTESVWNDIQFNIETGRTSQSNFPDWDSSFTTNTGAYKFDVDDYIDLGTNEMMHDWKEATEIYPHIHVALDGANASGGSQYAKFIIYIAYAKDGSVYTETNKEIEVEIPDGTADLTHLFEQSTALDMTGLTIGTQLNVRLKRIDATTGTEYPNHIFITQVGLHYEVNTMGSRQIGIK